MNENAPLWRVWLRHRMLWMPEVHVSGGTSLINATFRIPVNTKNCLTFLQCWNNVGDVGPTLYKCYTNKMFCVRWDFKRSATI